MCFFAVSDDPPRRNHNHHHHDRHHHHHKSASGSSSSTRGRSRSRVLEEEVIYAARPVRSVSRRQEVRASYPGSPSPRFSQTSYRRSGTFYAEGRGSRPVIVDAKRY